jgi:hypothetical protein
MINSNAEFLSNSLQYVYKTEIGERVNYTDNTGTTIISTANSNLDGTGTLATVVTGASNGTLIRSITIKAIVTTTRGMVRLYIEDSGATFTDLIMEVEIPATTQSPADQTFSTCMAVDFMLPSTYKLRASTQNAESFIVTAEGSNFTFP